MKMRQSGNPLLTASRFNVHTSSNEETMTAKGAVNKTGILLALTIFSATFTWTSGFGASSLMPLMLLSGLGGFALVLISSFKPHISPITAPIYAVLQGLFLGVFSSFINYSYPGLPFQAVGLTFAVLFMMLGLYQSGLIKVTEKFRFGVIAATGGLALFYLVTWIVSFFGVNIGFITGSGNFSILFSLFVVGLAALNLVLDFDFIDRASESKMPQYMEWFAALGLLVTLVWLYLELVRLLMKLRNRD
jgi:uncharacterized YccA/Bax inhibitor family protein